MTRTLLEIELPAARVIRHDPGRFVEALFAALEPDTTQAARVALREWGARVLREIPDGGLIEISVNGRAVYAEARP